MSNILTFEEASNPCDLDQYTKIVTAINRLLQNMTQHNSTSCKFLFKSITPRSVALKVIKELCEAGWTVAYDEAKMNTDQDWPMWIGTPSCFMQPHPRLSPEAEAFEKWLREHSDSTVEYTIDKNGNPEINCVIRTNSLGSMDENNISKHAYTEYHLNASAPTMDEAKLAIMDDYQKLTYVYPYMHKGVPRSQALHDLQQWAHETRRIGNTTNLVKLAKQTNGWLIVATHGQAIRLRKAHDYEHIYCVSSLTDLRGRDSAVLYIDNSVLDVL